MTVKATSDKGVYEHPIPDGVSKIQIQVKQSGFWDVIQKLILKTSKPTPSLEFDGGQEINVRNVDVHTRGSDFNAEVFVVPGQLRDAFTPVDNVAAQEGIDTVVQQPLKIKRFNTPILNPSGTGSSSLRMSEKEVNPRGELFFAERTSIPQLIAIYHPGWNIPKPPLQNPLKFQFPIIYFPILLFLGTGLQTIHSAVIMLT